MATMTMDFAAPRFTRGAATSAPVRLTARGRLVVRLVIVSVATGLAFFMLSIGHMTAVSALSGSPSVPHHAVVVRSGETLWQIASRELPGIDPRDAIARIRTLNALANTDVLVAGATVQIPAA